MRTLRLTLCYDGTRFSGWQAQAAQPGVRTIQGEIESALARITGTRPNVLGCGRTDAGVHALAQVATFRTDSRLSVEKFVPALNALLPTEIRVLRGEEVDPEFHPIRDVRRKRYRYLLSDRRPFFPFLKDYVWFVLNPLNVERMKAAAVFLIGEHDFRAFETTGSPRQSTVRTIFDLTVEPADLPDFWLPATWSGERKAAEMERAEGGGEAGGEAVATNRQSRSILMIEVEANGFLYNMVRAIAGTLALFGQGHAGFDDPTEMRRILDSRDRSRAGPTAPASGLYMIGVQYDSADGAFFTPPDFRKGKNEIESS